MRPVISRDKRQMAMLRQGLVAGQPHNQRIPMPACLLQKPYMPGVDQIKGAEGKNALLPLDAVALDNLRNLVDGLDLMACAGRALIT